MEETPEQAEERRHCERTIGRRKTDHGDGQVQWLEKHFSEVIKYLIEEAERRWKLTLKELLDAALGGDIPVRVSALEEHNKTREIRWALVAGVSALLGGGGVVVYLILADLLRVAA